jgi:hypothetical protein
VRLVKKAATNENCKGQNKLESYQSRFDKVKEVWKAEPGTDRLFEEIYPKPLSFCNNPYIKQKPENLNQPPGAFPGLE